MRCLTCVRLLACRRNQAWRTDFIHNRMADGRPPGIPVVLEEFTQECLVLELWRTS